jgi:hypothetical protein
VPWRSAVSGPPVDHQLELARRLDRKIAGIFASQHAIEISRPFGESLGIFSPLERAFFARI